MPSIGKQSAQERGMVKQSSEIPVVMEKQSGHQGRLLPGLQEHELHSGKVLLSRDRGNGVFDYL